MPSPPSSACHARRNLGGAHTFLLPQPGHSLNRHARSMTSAISAWFSTLRHRQCTALTLETRKENAFMDKFIVTVVPSEAASYAFLSSLQNLDTQGSIELYATEVLTKEPDGKLAQRSSEDTRGLATAVGTSVGALLGLLAGPVGFAVGAVAGGASGFASETAYSGVSGEFISNVGRSLAPGEYAVFAEAYEDWTFPVDEAARAAGGRVFRQATGEVIKAQDEGRGRRRDARSSSSSTRKSRARRVRPRPSSRRSVPRPRRSSRSRPKSTSRSPRKCKRAGTQRSSQ